MADSQHLFDVFGNHTTRKIAKNLLRQPLSHENMGKTVLEGPIKPNEPMKKAVKTEKPKKSFLCNAGKALQSTPARQIHSPMIVPASPMIYTEDKISSINLEEIEFTKPKHGYFDIYCDLFDSPFTMAELPSPPATPPPTGRYSMELISRDNISDFSLDSLPDEDYPDEDLGLPDLY